MFIRREKSAVCVNRHMGRLRESCPCGSLNHFHGAFLLGLPLASHFDLPGSKTVFGISQCSPKCVWASLSQGGSQQRGLWVAWHHSPFGVSLVARLVSLGFTFPGEGKASACNVGDLGSIPRLGRFPGEGNGNPLQYSCLEDPMDGGAS